jgi:hypothetical protein
MQLRRRRPEGQENVCPCRAVVLPILVDAADWLRHDLDVSKPLWGEACLAMGRECYQRREFALDPPV